MVSNPILFILGAGRSGTSALAGTLRLCGAALPKKLLGKNASNPKGHFEPIEALALNQEFLYSQRSSYFDPCLRLQLESVIDPRTREDFVERIVALLSTWPDRLLVVKEPRISVLAPYWLEAVRRIGRKSVAIVMVRSANEVAASLSARDNTSAELGVALWLKYNLLAERLTRELPRIFVAYEILLQDWRGEVDRISRTLSLGLATDSDSKVDDFLTKELHRQRSSGSHSTIDPWSRRVLAAMSDAARGNQLNTDELDAIFSELASAEYLMRTAYVEFKTRHEPPHDARRLSNEAVDWRNSAWRGHDSIPSDFDPAMYLTINLDVKLAGDDPFEHYVLHGKKEGRIWRLDDDELLPVSRTPRLGVKMRPEGRNGKEEADV